MKNSILKKWGLGTLALLVSLASMISSCDDSNDIGGTPVIESVYMLDTIARHKDSTFVAAEPYVLLVIHGQNIGGVIKAYFNGYETSFNTNYNTNTDLIIRVPPEAPTDSTADNTIRLVTASGEAIFGFKIIAKPAIYSFDKYTFGTGRGDITFKGKNFADMVSVVAFRDKDFPTEIITDSVVCEIISKSPEKIVVRIPENTLSRVTLHFTNSSGTSKGATVFVNADEALPIFTEDFANISTPDGDGKWSGDSWANAPTINSDQAFGGTKSVSVLLNAGAWSWFGFTSWWPRFYYYPEYKYVTFAIKGGAHDFPLWISCSTSVDGGNGSFPVDNEINVTAKVWNYYRIAIEDLDLVYDGSIIQQIGFRPKGPDNAELIYLDDFMLVK